MNILEIFALGVGLSMDAFAAAVCIGLTTKVKFKKILTVGLYFGGFQALMPLIGYFAASFFSDFFVYGNFLAFVLLCFLGIKSIREAFKKEECEEIELTTLKLLSLAVATSIDALAVGGALAFLQVKIISVVSVIGVVTFIISMLGVKIGSAFGIKFRAKAQFIGGVILALIGFRILFDF